ncbi:hypothetical protein CIG75_00280 [Tumebacillus algifaecis]|uniref:Uncharacterized protein n=1 Tax=Tumebacillus algifaecis TaxID=1214604 RepID=A0A223CW88_9BACL|nr:hypothetical protein [Tumebacillus algifaecis]ASS73561.1 hypothetical protein CIG75_00280 [Tumebacillus algifaecis]
MEEVVWLEGKAVGEGWVPQSEGETQSGSGGSPKAGESKVACPTVLLLMEEVVWLEGKAVGEGWVPHSVVETQSGSVGSPRAGESKVAH